jgi:hypothetical protein
MAGEVQLSDEKVRGDVVAIPAMGRSVMRGAFANGQN